ncbi:helix-turn-helix domain-containing protein [Bacteroidota bacterium]
MAETIATLSDILQMKTEILEALEEYTQSNNHSQKKWIRGPEAREMLSISSSKLQNMRIMGDIPYSKIGTTYYYPVDEIHNVLKGNLRKNE